MNKRDFEEIYCKPKNKIIKAAGLPYRLRAEKNSHGDYDAKWNYSDFCSNLAESLVAAQKVRNALEEHKKAQLQVEV